jgi:phosphoribosyl-ATP pyrophosphohydrolase/phosphoribosyl-AMP cyclohydrolase
MIKTKKLVPYISLEDENAVNLAKYYSDAGADELLVFGFSDSDEAHDKAIGILREIARVVEIPIIASDEIKRVEDVKKLLYAGASKAVLNYANQSNIELTEEVSKRFGKEKIAVSVDNIQIIANNKTLIANFADEIVFVNPENETVLKEVAEQLDTPVLPVWNVARKTDIKSVLSIANVSGISVRELNGMKVDFMQIKQECKEAGIPVSLFESSMQWSDFKLNSDGMVPVIVQDYITDEVLMLAYMNEEAYNNTVATGKMTYYSRSRDELWVKGLTSGHFQYVKSLTADCDVDTILAKVSQVGAACHTGSRTCFFNKLVEKEGTVTNPLKVFEEVYNVIADRKENPKEGSYTNYLFDKGIDKILKKVGEEATEIVIAAKNPDPEEIKYEASDFLYHLMVLMVERGVTWSDITKELANR